MLDRWTKYSQETKKTVTIKQKLLGKLVGGKEPMVPTRPKRLDGVSQKLRAAQQSAATRLHTCITDILDRIGKVSGIDDDVRKAFPDGETADKILSIARYWVATGGQTLPRTAAWQVMHKTPHAFTISDETLGDLFQDIGMEEDGIQRYFRLRASSLGANPAIAYDSTTVSSYSRNQHEARKGFNFDGRRTRLWHSDALRGRQFVQFIGLGYFSRFVREIEKVKDGLGVKRDGAPQEQLKMEKEHKGWIKARSNVDIFDWFDCIETTKAVTETSKFRWSMESVKRDQLFLQLLGVRDEPK